MTILTQPWEIHPALVHFPIAFLIGAVALDLFAAWRRDRGLQRVVTGLMLAGVATGTAAAGAGFLAYATVPAHAPEAHNWMRWHLGLGLAGLAVFVLLSFVRWRRRDHVATWSTGLSAVGAVLIAATGYLGGQIVYHGGAGVEPALLAPAIRGEHSHAAGDDHAHGASDAPASVVTPQPTDGGPSGTPSPPPVPPAAEHPAAHHHHEHH